MKTVLLCIRYVTIVFAFVTLQADANESQEGHLLTSLAEDEETRGRGLSLWESHDGESSSSDDNVEITVYTSIDFTNNLVPGTWDAHQLFCEGEEQRLCKLDEHSVLAVLNIMHPRLLFCLIKYLSPVLPSLLTLPLIIGWLMTLTTKPAKTIVMCMEDALIMAGCRLVHGTQAAHTMQPVTPIVRLALASLQKHALCGVQVKAQPTDQTLLFAVTVVIIGIERCGEKSC